MSEGTMNKTSGGWFKNWLAQKKQAIIDAATRKKKNSRKRNREKRRKAIEKRQAFRRHHEGFLARRYKQEHGTESVKAKVGHSSYCPDVTAPTSYDTLPLGPDWTKARRKLKAAVKKACSATDRH
jgi:hypothetical protein